MRHGCLYLLFLLFFISCFSPLRGWGVEAQTENTDETIEALNVWFKRNYESVGNKLKLEVRHASGSGGGHGVYALEPIQKEELYLSIPKVLVLSLDHFRTNRKQEAAALDAAGFDRPLQRLAVLLLVERRAAEMDDTYFKPYLDSLPTLMDTPNFYSQAEMGELKGTSIPSKVKADRHGWEEMHRRLVSKVFSKDRRLFPEESFGWKRYEWAQSVVNTRAIWVGGKPSLVPFLDMINCKELGDKKRVHSTKSEGAFANTYSPATFLAGEQVFENYGQKNSIYFQHHGFSLKDNSHDCLDLSPRAYIEETFLRKATSTVREGFAEQLRAEGVALHREHCVAPGRAPRELLSLLRLVSAYQAERVAVAGYKAELAPTLEGGVYDMIIDMCHRFIEGFTTTPRADEQLLSDPSLSFRFRQIVQFRLEQKRLAMKIVRWADYEAQQRYSMETVSGSIDDYLEEAA